MKKIIMVAMFWQFMPQIVWADYPYIDDFSAEAKGLVNTPIDAGQVKQLEGYTNKPKEADYAATDLKKLAQDKQMAAKAILTNKNASARDKIEAESIQAFKEGRYSNKYRSVYTASKLQNKDFIKKSDNVTENPIGVLNVVGDSECAVTANDTQKEEVSLKEYEVEVPEIILKEREYQCEEDVDQLFYCEKALSVNCKKRGDNCGTGGIVVDSLKTDVEWKREGQFLTFGTIKDNIWPGKCDEHRITTSFDIKNRDLIEEFTLTEVAFDDYLQIKINDQLIFNGPYGGYKLEIKEVEQHEDFWSKHISSRITRKVKQVDTGNGQYNCELHTDWRQQPNIDLLPYLKEGSNKIEVLVLVYGWGEFWMKIKARQHCCEEWSEEIWRSDCPL
jgi:hypothetical protein